MKQSGVIYQYVDKPAAPDTIVMDAFRESDVLPTITPFISVPAIPVVETIRPSFPSKEVLKTRLSYGFRAMIGGGVIGLIVLLAPFFITEARFRMNPPKPQEEIVFPDIEIVNDTVDTPTFTNLVNEKYIKKINPVNTEYAIVIPKIGVNSPIIANVDPANKKEYDEALKKGAAQAKGTALPGEAGSQYIFAHSTDYVWRVDQFNAIFYLLKDLENGDQVHIVYNGKLYPYKVTDKKVVNADDTYYLKNDLNENRLILQTCWPPGTAWKRMLVFAEPIDSLLGSGDNVSYSLDKSETN